MDIKGKVAIVTGGASGLGEATVRRYHGAGAKVAIFDMNADRGAALPEDRDGLFRRRPGTDACQDRDPDGDGARSEGVMAY